MFLIYRDELGMITVDIDENGVSFNDGVAFATCTDGEDLWIPMKDVLYVGYLQKGEE